MTQITDQDLVLHYYGESPDRDAVAAALERSPELAARFRDIAAVLDAVSSVEAAEAPAGYGANLWAELQPHLDRRRSLWPLGFDRRWGLAAAALVVLVVTFLAGRLSAPPVEAPRQVSPAHRILVANVTDHLQRVELLLLELLNAEDGPLQVADERARARELTADNRLYRQAARRQGDLRTANVLSELEFVLLEVAHGPESLDADDLDELKARLERSDLLFKIQVVRSRLDHSGRTHRRLTSTSQNDA